MNTKIEIQYRDVIITVPLDGNNSAAIEQWGKESVDTLWDGPSEQAPIILLSEAIKLTYQHRWAHNKDAKRTMGRMKLILNILEDMPVGSINTTTVRLLRQILEKTKTCKQQYRAARTVNQYLKDLRTVLEYCKECGYLKSLPEIVTGNESRR